MSFLDDKKAEVDAAMERDPRLGRKMAKYGAIGAVIAIPLPFVGPILGAVVGAAVAYQRRDKI